jgi:hypothetical protein
MVTRPAPAPALRRIGALRRTSPGRLQLLTAVLVTCALLSGLVAGLTGYATSSGTTDLGNRAQPLLVEAETIYAKLADANTTANQAFLSGGLEPAELTQRYDDDLTQATTALASAARRTAEGSDAGAAITAITTSLALYTAQVATARADNRQGLPVGASYLSAASQTNVKLLAQSQRLFQIAQQEVTDGYANARSAIWLTVLFLLLLVLLIALVLGQRYLSRTTHRTFNVPLLAATVLTLILALGTAGLLISQHRHLHRADTEGSRPAAQLAEARILALRERGDEALALAAHTGDAKDSKFIETDKVLTAALTNDFLSDATRADHAAYVAAHQKIPALDSGGDYEGAVKQAVGPVTTAAFENLLGDLGGALDQRKAAFTGQIDDAGRGLGLFTVLGPLLALIIAALAVAGVRARLEEYR